MQRSNDGNVASCLQWDRKKIERKKINEFLAHIATHTQNIINGNSYLVFSLFLLFSSWKFSWNWKKKNPPTHTHIKSIISSKLFEENVKCHYKKMKCTHSAITMFIPSIILRSNENVKNCLFNQVNHKNVYENS